MAAGLAMDLRNRVMTDVDAGLSAEKAAEKYSVSARTIYHGKALRRETGSLAARDGKTGLQHHTNRRCRSSARVL